jgi:hypothetical protein
VFELKKPGVTKVEEALQQALRYATALDIEANEGKQENRENYHTIFGSKGKGRLEIGAVVVLEDKGKIRRDAPAILQQYWAEHGDSKIDRIGMLLYKFDQNKVKSWEWLPGWDARKLPRSSQKAAG